MRIVIDTKHDSPEEIKHVINMLTTMLGEKIISTKTEPTERRDIFGNIFGPVKSSRETQKTEETKEEGIDIKDLDIDQLETY